MKTLGEIDEEFNSLLEIESKKFKEKLGDLKNKAKKDQYEQEFKKKISYLMKKREKEVKNFISKHKDLLFPKEDKKEEKKEEGPRYLDVKHLDLELNKKDRSKIKRNIKKFKRKVWWSNLYYHVIPGWVFFRVFKVRFACSNFFRNIGRSVGYFFKRMGKKFTRFGKKWAERFKNLYTKILEIWKKFTGFFVKKKKEKKEGEEGSEEKSEKSEGETEESSENKDEEKKEE